MEISDVPTVEKRRDALGASLEYRAVTKAYGPTQVLSNFSFTVEPGERVVIIGPSGSGKTTVLRLAMGLVAPSSGEVWLNGARYTWPGIEGRRERRRWNRQVRETRQQVSMVFQSLNLFPHMSAIENVCEAPIHVLGVSRDQARDEALRLLDLVGLKSKAERYPSQLSGGEQQRVAIARAVAMAPKLLLFDEITSALDPELVGDVLDVVRSLTETLGATMLFVTHEIQFALEVADRIVMMENGDIVEIGTPEYFRSGEASERTKRFIRRIVREDAGD